MNTLSYILVALCVLNILFAILGAVFYKDFNTDTSGEGVKAALEISGLITLGTFCMMLMFWPK